MFFFIFLPLIFLFSDVAISANLLQSCHLLLAVLLSSSGLFSSFSSFLRSLFCLPLVLYLFCCFSCSLHSWYYNKSDMSRCKYLCKLILAYKSDFHGFLSDKNVGIFFLVLSSVFISIQSLLLRFGYFFSSSQKRIRLS